jgi:hypothetical protein
MGGIGMRVTLSRVTSVSSWANRERPDKISYRTIHEDLALPVPEKVGGFGNPEVGQLHHPFPRDHDVLRAHVPVDHAQGLARLVRLLMGVFEAAADPAHQERRQVHGDPLALLEVPVHELLEVDPVDVLHRDVVLLPDLPQLIDLHDVLMDQVGDQLRLADEHLDELGVLRELLEDRLDRHGFFETLRPELLGLENRAHPPLGDLPYQLEFVVVFEVLLHRAHPERVVRLRLPNLVGV